MGLKLKTGVHVTQSPEKINGQNNSDWDGVKKNGGAINPYGVNHNDLSLELFDKERESNNLDEKVELKLTGVNDFELDNDRSIEQDEMLARNSIAQAIDHRTYTSTVEEDGPLRIVMMIIAYVAVVVKLACIGWVCSQNVVDIIYNVTPMQWIINGVAVVILIDAIVVNVIHKKSISLIIIALLLDFLYPLQRGKHTEVGEMIGGVLTVTLLIAYGAFILLAGKAINNYGNVIRIDDEQVRTQAAIVLDQEINGTRLGNRIMKAVEIEEANYGQQDGKESVVLRGNGSVTLRNGNFVMGSYYDTKTTLGFVKSSTGQYELASVTLGDQTLTDQYLSYYWEKIIK